MTDIYDGVCHDRPDLDGLPVRATLIANPTAPDGTDWVLSGPAPMWRVTCLRCGANMTRITEPWRLAVSAHDLDVIRRDAAARKEARA